MVVEAFDRVFKYNYLNGKLNKTVDSCLITATCRARKKQGNSNNVQIPSSTAFKSAQAFGRAVSRAMNIVIIVHICNNELFLSL